MCKEDIIKLIIPSNPQYLQVIRLAAASLANRVGFDCDDIEDIKVLISEMVNYIIPINESIDIEFCLKDASIAIKVTSENTAYEGEADDEQLKIKKQILLTLADEIKYEDRSFIIVKNK